MTPPPIPTPDAAFEAAVQAFGRTVADEWGDGTEECIRKTEQARAALLALHAEQGKALAEARAEVDRRTRELETQRRLWAEIHRAMGIEPDGLCAALGWIDDAKQLRAQLAEARAEVERLRAGATDALPSPEAVCDEILCHIDDGSCDAMAIQTVIRRVMRRPAPTADVNTGLLAAAKNLTARPHGHGPGCHACNEAHKAIAAAEKQAGPVGEASK